VPQDISVARAIEIADAGDLEIAGMRTEINAAGPSAVVHQLLVEVAGRGVVLLIEQMKFTIKKLRHERFGQSSERHAVLD
jgi:transposase